MVKSIALSVISTATGVQSCGIALKMFPTSMIGTCLYARPGSVDSFLTFIDEFFSLRITIRAEKPRAALSACPTLTPSVGLSKAMQANPRWANVDFRSICRLVFRFDLGVYLDFNLIYDWDIFGYTLVPIG